MPNPIAAAEEVHNLPRTRPFTAGLLGAPWPIALLVSSFVLLYAHVVVKLVHDWATDDNASHGFLVVPLAAYLAWERRAHLRRIERSPSSLGLVIVLGSVAVLAAGTLGSELFLARVSMLGVLAGAIVFLLGWRHLRTLAFPIAFLLLMIPLPAILFNQIALPLQLLASRVGEQTLMAFGIPVLREGNVIILAHTTLEVVEACSGIRSLAALITLAVVYGYFTDPRNSVRLAIVVSSVPIAVVANAVRVAGTGVAAQYYGPGVAEGFFHTFSGWVVFTVAFAAMLGVRAALVSGMQMASRWRFGLRKVA
ncbi:MAG: exosortase A [Acidobacteriota bacterium]